MARSRTTFRGVVDQVQAGLVAPGRIVTEEFPLEDAQRAFVASETAPGKTMIRVDP